ncbi:MAG: Sua5/YciO/YrdC/YwlC family protein, partial [Pirellulales bacterium]
MAAKLQTYDRDLSRPTAGDRGQPSALRIVLGGRVQGLGVRPSVARLAHELHLAGFVGNTSQGVSIHVEGRLASVTQFQRLLPQRLPPEADIGCLTSEVAEWIGVSGFHIDASATCGPLAVCVPPDVAVCEQCLADVAASKNRRHGYLLTTCTVCGPRYSLIDSMPYDRVATTMRQFALCPDCSQEYARPADRRFHSQTNGCHACGPQLWLSDGAKRLALPADAVVPRAVAALRSGRILAVRGVGGYQLLVDATQPSAVRELRRRKLRMGKPLAVMIADMAAADRLAVVGPVERHSLSGAQNPIVVVHAKVPSDVAGEVTEGLNSLGLMLPTTALHAELARELGRPMVVTSGNREGDPLAFEADAARRDLASVADVWLEHDRPIAQPIDDSVVRLIAGKPATVRLGRGLAPLSLAVPTRPMLALGGHQKAG